MRILFITPYVPSRIRVRPYNIIRRLAKQHEVTLVALVQSDLDRQSLEEMTKICAQVCTIKMSKVQSVMSCGRRLLTKMPLQAAYTYMPDLIRCIDDLIVKQPFDVIHVEHVRGAHFAEHIGSIPKVYDSVDCITLLLRQFLQTKRNPVSWFIALEEWAKMRVYEAMITQQFDKVVITSKHDQKALEGLIWDRVRKQIGVRDIPKRPPETAKELDEWRVTKQLIEMAQDQRLDALMPQSSRVSVLPNGVDHDYFTPMAVQEEPGSVVFSGKMSYYANVAAVKNFYENIFPLIREKKPETKFIIAGADPPPAIQKLAADRSVRVTGYVDDIRPYIAKSAVAVCPITVGVGIQNKVLEAMSMGKPVVATSRASGAISAKNGSEIFLADDPVDFAAQVVRLIDDPETRKMAGENAASYVRNNHDWDTISHKLENVYQEAKDLFGSKIIKTI